MATVVIYNNVELHNVTTREWREEVVYDASGTDLLYRTVHMRFEGLLHRAATGDSPGSPMNWGPCYIVPPVPNPNLTTVELFNIVRPLLLMPRQPLTIVMNGNTVLNVAVSGTYISADVDLNNGPKPTAVTLAHVASDEVFRLTFSVDCSVDANNSPVDSATLGGGTAVINNRWSITETVDEHFAISRLISGHLRLGKWCVNSQDFRNVVVPPLETSFKRDRMHFQVSENGLDCDYAILDRQVHVAAPWPACKLDAIYTESSNDGQTFYGDMSVNLEGPINAGVQFLMVQALRIIDTRLDIYQHGAGEDQQDFNILSMSLTEHIGEVNAVEAHVRIKHTREAATVNGIATLWFSNFGQGITGTELLLDLTQYGPLPGQPANYDVWTSQAPALFGYLPGSDTPRQAAFLYLLGCYYQDPWHPEMMMGGNSNASENVGTGTDNKPTVTVSPSASDNAPAADTQLSTETQTATYSYARVHSRYFSVGCKAVLPIATDDDDPDTATSTFITLAPVQFRREIHYDHERIGDWPEIVGSDDTYTDGYSINGTCLSSWDKVLPPGLTADKKKTVQRIIGYRLYALDRPPQRGEKVRTGLRPETKLSQDDNSVDLIGLQTDRMQA